MENSHSPHMLILPFRLNIDPMERLLVANFKGDPEFEAIEPQVFDDDIYGKGMRVLRYRKDGSVDVYWQAGVNVDKKSFTVGTGIHDFMETIIQPARFEITDHGLEVQIAFDDAQGRKVNLVIQENASDKAGFPLLAPVGADIANPVHFFLVYMPNMDFVRYAGTVINGQIGDRILYPASLPILYRGKRIHFARYIDKPIISSLNPAMDRPVTAELPVPGSVEVDGMLIEVDGKGSVISLSTGKKLCEMNFNPGFPNLIGLVKDKSYFGKWSIKITGVRITGGTYNVSQKNGSVSVELDVMDHWKPINLPLSVKFLTLIVSKFRTWPSTYRWRGSVEIAPTLSLSGKWERVRR